MILTVEELKIRTACDGLDDKVIESRLKAIEGVIRKYTHNNFQNRNMRFISETPGGSVVPGVSPYIRINDTVQISQSEVNNGLYTVVAVGEESTTLDANLFPCSWNMVTKIVYPVDVIECAIRLFEWQKEFGGKIGIKSESETLSRHSESVTYEDSTTLYGGYPVGILSGLDLYCKARF